MSCAPQHSLVDQDICAKCSQKNGGCCIADPSYVSRCFPLSVPEVLRLLPYSDLAEGFGELLPDMMLQKLYKKVKTTLSHEQNFSQREYTFEDIAQKASQVVTVEITQPTFIWPLKAILPQYANQIEDAMPEGQHHFRLRTLENGACALLGPQGCRVPREARPWYCQSYPGWLYRNKVSLLLDSSCFAMQDTNTPSIVLAKLGMTDSDIYFFYEQMLLDWEFTS